MKTAFAVGVLACLAGPALAQEPPAAPPTEPAPTVLDVAHSRQWAEPLSDPAVLSKYYPERALRKDTEGWARLKCVSLPDRHLGCEVLSEAPEMFGFGDAALKVARELVFLPEDQGVHLAPGAKIVVPVRFQLG